MNIYTYIFFVFHLYFLFDLDDLSIFFFFFLNNVRFFLSCIFTRASKSSGFSVHPHLEFYTSSREYFSQSQSRSFASFFLFRNAHSFLRFIVPINSSFRHKLTHLHLDFLFLVIIIESEALFYFFFFENRDDMTLEREVY